MVSCGHIASHPFSIAEWRHLLPTWYATPSFPSAHTKMANAVPESWSIDFPSHNINPDSSILTTMPLNRTHEMTLKSLPCGLPHRQCLLSIRRSGLLSLVLYTKKATKPPELNPATEILWLIILERLQSFRGSHLKHNTPRAYFSVDLPWESSVNT